MHAAGELSRTERMCQGLHSRAERDYLIAQSRVRDPGDGARRKQTPNAEVHLPMLHSVPGMVNNSMYMI